MKITCIMCPMGCNINAIEQNGEINVENYGCNRGIKYAKQELIKPQRVITSLAVLVDGNVFSCKTDGMVDKDKIFDVLREIKLHRFQKPIKMNQILIENVLEIGVNIISTQERV